MNARDDVPLREYVEALLEELTKRVEQRFDSNDIAIRLGREAVDARLTLLNELRGIVTDRLGNTITRPEHDKLVGDVQELQKTQANRDGRMWVVSGSMSTIAVLAMWIISHWKQ